MSALLALIPLKDKIYGAIIIAVLAFGVYEYYHIQAAAAARQHTADIAAEAKAAKAAQDQKAADDADYATKLKTITDASNANLQVAHDAADALAARLRTYQAHRCPSGVLQGATTAPTGGAAPADRAGTAGQSAVDTAVDNAIIAAFHDLAVIKAERAERDALTGK